VQKSLEEMILQSECKLLLVWFDDLICFVQTVAPAPLPWIQMIMI
jgi:hypothetical protein